MGNVITFYSYKGGVGRSMSLANIGVLLSRWGYKVLLVDWDLEAPGLENFFQPFLTEDLAYKEGLIDLIDEFKSIKIYDDAKHTDRWKSYVSEILKPVVNSGQLDLLTAGKRMGKDSNIQTKIYYEKVRQFDVESFYKKYNGGRIIEMLRSSWKKNYDFTLVDSRTGITEIGGICTIQLPDILVLLYTATEASFNGIANVAMRAKKAQQELLVDRLRLLCLPILSRVDGSEKELTSSWIRNFITGAEHIPENLKTIYENWVPSGIDISALLNHTRIPHVAYYSFGEGLPVQNKGFETDVQGIGYSYLSIAGLLATSLNFPALLIENKSQLLKLADKNWVTAEKERYFEKIIQEIDKIPPFDITWISSLEKAIKLSVFNEELEIVIKDMFKNTLRSPTLTLSALMEIADTKTVSFSDVEVSSLFEKTLIDILSDHFGIWIYFRLKNIDRNLLFLIMTDLNDFIASKINEKAANAEFMEYKQIEQALSAWYADLAKNICDKLSYLLTNTAINKNLSNHDDAITEYIIGSGVAISSEDTYKSQETFFTKKIKFLLYAIAVIIIAGIIGLSTWNKKQASAYNRSFYDSLTTLKSKSGTGLQDARCRLSEFNNKNQDELIKELKDSLRKICDDYLSLVSQIRTNDSIVVQTKSNLLSMGDSLNVILKKGAKIDNNEAKIRETKSLLQLSLSENDTAKAKQLIKDTLNLSAENERLIASVPLLKTASIASDFLGKVQSRIDSIAGKKNGNAEIHSAWFKKGYFLQFANIKILLTDLSKPNQNIVIEVYDMTNPSFIKEPIKIKNPVIPVGGSSIFEYQGDRYEISLDRIASAGKNPFTQAAYITFSKYKAN